MIKNSKKYPSTKPGRNQFKGKLGVESKVMKSRGLTAKKNQVTSNAKSGLGSHSVSGTQPGKNFFKGSLTVEQKTIAKGIKKIANRTTQPRQKSHKYTVGQLGKAAHEATARH